MTLYRRKDSPVWWCDITVGGRRIRQSTGCEGKREARQVEADLRAEMKNATARPSQWRVRHLLGTYWEDVAKHKSAEKTFKYQLAALSDGLGPNTPVMSITGTLLMAYIAGRRASVRTLKGGATAVRARSNASINRELGLLRAALNHAADVHEQPIPRIIWKKIVLAEPAERVRYLTFAEYEAMLAAATDDELRLMIALACASGLRRENVRGITWDNVDLINGRINVVAKGDRNFQAKLSGSPLEWLRRHAAEAQKAAGGKLEGAVFTAPNWRRRWEATRKRSGVRNYRWHDHRHTFASWARMAGVDLADVADALNHTTLQMTRRYAHITPEYSGRAWDRVAQLQPFTTQEQEEADGREA